MSRYRDNIETFSFNVAGGYLIAEFNKMVKPDPGNAADLSWAIAANIDTESYSYSNISIRMYFYKDYQFNVLLVFIGPVKCSLIYFVAVQRGDFSLK